MRILAVDYGERRTGLAVSDELGITAQGLDTLVVKDANTLPKRVAEVASEWDANRILLGLPLHMHGGESEKSEAVRRFGSVLADKYGLEVVYWDERLTSVQAQRVLHEMGEKLKGRKEKIDRISATLMLQEYLRTQP